MSEQPQQIKLTYFKYAGLAELPRLIFTAGGVPFEDERIEKSDMVALKPTLPLGQLPVLTIDRTVFGQSMAIARYAARKGGLYPSDAQEALKVDMVSYTVGEVWDACVETLWSDASEDVKAEQTRTFLSETVPKFLGLIQDHIQGNYIMGDSMTYADLHLFIVVHDWMVPKYPDFELTSYPKVQTLIESVKANANIAAYLAKRP